MEQRYKGLNRRIFKRNLKAVLKPELSYYIDFKSVFEDFVTDYINCAYDNCIYGWYEVESFMTKYGHSEVIKTN